MARLTAQQRQMLLKTTTHFGKLSVYGEVMMKHLTSLLEGVDTAFEELCPCTSIDFDSDEANQFMSHEQCAGCLR